MHGQQNIDIHLKGAFCWLTLHNYIKVRGTTDTKCAASHCDISNLKQACSKLTLWRRNYFFLILALSVYKM